MALLQNSFITDDVEDVSFAPVPPGMYTMQITKSEIKTTKSGNGEYISLQMVIMDEGSYAGRTVFTNLNIVNPNEKAVQIARSQLKNICKSVGITEFQDTQELHGIPFLAKLKIVPGRDGYDDRNEVAKFSPLDGSVGNTSADASPWAS